MHTKFSSLFQKEAYCNTLFSETEVLMDLVFFFPGKGFVCLNFPKDLQTTKPTFAEPFLGVILNRLSEQDTL